MTCGKKIAILCNFPIWLVDKKTPFHKGHFGTWLVGLYEGFKTQSDFEIHWITLSKTTRKARTVQDGLQYFHILPRTKKTIGLYTGYIYDRLLISNCIKSIEPDMLHAWGTEDCYALAGSRFKSKKLLSIQGLLTHFMKLAPMSRFERHQGKLYEALAIRAYPYLSGESPYAMENMHPLSPKSEMFLLEYAISPQFYQITRNPAPTPYFVFAGTYSLRKNLQLLIKAFSTPELSHLELKLAGVAKNAVPNLPPNITPLGSLGREEMAEVMSKSWGVLCPSLTENAPNVINEARVLALPVVLSDECGSKQYVVEGKSGYIIKPHDLDGMKKAVLKLSDSLELNIEMGLFDHERCRRRLSKEFMVEQITKIYTKILND